MTMLINIFYIVAIISLLIAVYVKIQLSSIGLTISEFLDFIKANETLEKLEKKSHKADYFSETDRLTFLMESEEVFNVFDKVPSVLWEDLYPTYTNVLNTYRDIKMLRWAQA